MLLVQIIPFQLLIIPIYVMIVRTYGLADSYLGMIVPFAINSTAVFIFRQFFLQLPEELFAAARLDGASELRILWSIALPLVRPALLTAILLTFIGPWNEFLWPFLVTKEADMQPLAVVARQLHQQRGRPGREPVRRDPRRRGGARRPRGGAVRRVPEALHRLRPRVGGQGMSHRLSATARSTDTTDDEDPMDRTSAPRPPGDAGSPSPWPWLRRARRAAPALPSAATDRATSAPAPRPAAPAPLTNLDHLDWLSVPVTPPDQEGHTTYRLAEEPEIGVLWTYAEPNPDGSFRHVGGGTYDPETDTWGQGAFNADDVSRAAVVYLRHWQATGSTDSRDAAYEMLRGLTYLQTASGPNAGNVVLWMQPDGTLNPSAEPVELPDPSDSDASYWLARTIWALGEGYAAFEDDDPAFAAFLRDRLELSIDAVDRQVLDRYGEHLDIDGEPAPAWLIADGADATAEAVLGLSAYVAAGGSAEARTALARLSEGIAELQRRRRAGTGRWARSVPGRCPARSGTPGARRCPAALAGASVVLDDPALAEGAVSDSFTFDPWLLTSGGPDNGRLPTRGDASQIAYGADSRLQSLLATADADRRDHRGRVRPRRDRGGVVLRRQPRRRADVRPGHRSDVRRHLRLAARSTATPGPSPRSTGCCR